MVKEMLQLVQKIKICAKRVKENDNLKHSQHILFLLRDFDMCVQCQCIVSLYKFFDGGSASNFGLMKDVLQLLLDNHVNDLNALHLKKIKRLQNQTGEFGEK